MRCNYAMTFPKDISPEEEREDANGAEQDDAEREEGAAKSDCRDRNWVLLRLTVT